MAERVRRRLSGPTPHAGAGLATAAHPSARSGRPTNRSRRRLAPRPNIPSPMTFFGHLNWIDGRKLTSVIEPYRAQVFDEALYNFEADGRPRYNLVLAGRAKKNWKSADLVLAAFYRFFAWPSAAGNDCFLLANDEGQAGDDLSLAKKMIAANPILDREVDVQAKEVIRNDGAGSLRILPAKDVAGSHGKTYLFVGFDEIHAYRNWDILEALAPDPTRLDALTWITSYASIFNSAGAPLYDMLRAGKRDDDPRMFFSWYAADYTTDPDFEDAEPEARANPSMESWGNPDYLDQQRRRLPSHKFRRLHKNLPGLPDGAAFDADVVMDAIKTGRKKLKFDPTLDYVAFVDMSGGSLDDATLAISHRDKVTERAVLDLVMSQSSKPPFNPRRAVKKFTGILKGFGLSRVTGDRYAGETFRQDFSDNGIAYSVSPLPKSAIYEAIEPMLNAGEIELLDAPKLQAQLLGLVWRGSKIDHMSGEHDDWANAAAGALVHAAAVREYQDGDWDLIPLYTIEGEEGWHPHPGSGLVSGLVEEQDIGWR